VLVMACDPHSIAAKAGASIGGDFGRQSFEALLDGYVSGLMPPKYSNLTTLRTKAHTTLYGPRGIQKSTFLDAFLETIPSNFKVAHLSFATVEILCGSITNPRNPLLPPRVIPSVFTGVDFVKLSEEWSVIGHAGSVEAKISFFNDSLEGARISSSLVKLGQVTIDPKQKEELERLGVTYNSEEATVSFVPKFVCFSASHLYNRKILGLLNDFGYRDRFRIVQLKLTSEVAKERFQQEYVPDQAMLAELKKVNQELSTMKIKAVETPPKELFKPVYANLFRMVDCPDFRLKGDILRAASSNMVLRHYSEGKLKEVYTQQDYTFEDSQYIIDRLPSFVEPRIHPLVAGGFEEIGKTRVRDHAKDYTVAFLEGSAAKGRPGEALSAIHSFVLARMPRIHFQTVTNGLNELVRAGVVERVHGMHGFYRISKGENKTHETTI
jgi:hypothetical protein